MWAWLHLTVEILPMKHAEIIQQVLLSNGAAVLKLEALCGITVSAFRHVFLFFEVGLSVTASFD